MASTPKFNYFDGSGTTTDLTITTNLSGLVFTGVVDANTVDVQVNINGSGWVSDPSLVDLSLPDFIIPNLSSYPDGLELEKGQNVLQLRAVDLSGSYSAIATATVTVLSPNEANTNQIPPTGLQLQRNALAVELQWSDYTPNAVGYNVYASTGAGGTESGYLRVNNELIPVATPTTTTTDEFPLSNEFSYDLNNPLPGVMGVPNSTTNLLVLLSKLQSTTTGALDMSASSQYATISTVDLTGVSDFRIKINVSQLLINNHYSFTHNREDGIGDGILNSEVFAVIDRDLPLFYVITSVFYDKQTGQLIESRYSQEISGAPLPIDLTVRGIRIREQAVVTSDYIGEVQAAQPTLSMIPGSTVREVHIEPFANEIQKAYFLMDFVSRARSFEALLQIDDPARTGTSVPVSTSAYKQSLRTALSLSSDAAVQSLIDGAFSSLAGNNGVQRLGRRPSVVIQTFFTAVAPINDMIVTQGAIVSSSNSSTAPRFRAGGAAVLSAANALAYYNPNTKRYEVRVQMTADVTGSDGNVPASTLDTVVSGADGFQTINEVAADRGRDVQSNLELSEDASRTLYSLDTGTTGGYTRTSVGTPGLFEVKVVEAGNAYMMRDYDDLRQKHIGGKVDIYVKGTTERTITETFAFQFEIAKNIRFDVIDPVNLIFRARDSRLDESNPISEMLDNPSQGLGFRNHSDVPTQTYDLTGITIVDFQTIQLSSIIPQPVTMLDDFVEGDYRFRSNNKFTASKQPVIRVVSVTGEISGVLDPNFGYTLYKTEDPLLLGESTKASNYATINQVDDVPSGDAIQVNDEKHVMVGQYEELLDSIGINTFTLKVYDENRVIEYQGPDTANPDYLFIAGTQTSPIKLIRTTSSNIPSGSTISVDYQHDENFVVAYVINDVLQQLQTKIEASRHATADVIAKQALENPLAIEATVQLLPNTDQSVVDQNIRTSYTVLTDTKGIGGSIHQSDIIAVIDNTIGTDFVVQPFAKCTLQNGAQRIRDQIVSSGYEFLPTLSRFANAVYILTQSLPFNTTDGAGPDNIHHGVFMDDLQLPMARSLNTVGNALNNAWVIGYQGAIIPGYSDDATLAPVFITADDIAAERVRRTANKVLVSLNYGIIPVDVPSNHTFAVSYVVANETGHKDIDTSQIEYLTPGSLTLTYRRE